MLVEKLSIKGHPAIGTVDLDFRDQIGDPARRIVIAGDNGVGKTVIIEAIHSLFETISSFPCQVDADLVIDRDEALRISKTTPPVFTPERRRIHVRRVPHSTLMAFAEEHFGGEPFGVDNSSEKFGLRSFYSEANVLFPGDDLKNVSADRLDRHGIDSARSGNVQGIQIPQLLLALHYEDLNNYFRFERQNCEDPRGVVPSALDRFRYCIGMMFPDKILSDFRQESGRFSIIFKENDVETSIHQLSTGEKQVIFRAGFFIRDAAIMRKSVILIDEPELSLSPDWQSRILDFYAKSLSFDRGQHPQIICATHSPFIVHSMSAGKVIVLRRESDGRVRPMTSPAYPDIRSSVAIQAFNLDRFISEVQPESLAVITEGKTDVEILRAAWQALHPGLPMPFTLHAGTGARALQSASNGPTLSALARSGKVVGLFDFDDAWSQWNGVWKDQAAIVTGNDSTGFLKKNPSVKAWAMLLPVPDYRREIAGIRFKSRSRLSIELMFPTEAIPTNMLDLEEQVGGTNVQLFRDGCKMCFAQQVTNIESLHFAAFGSLFSRLREILAE